MGPRRRALLVFFLGIALILSPVFTPANVPVTQTYGFEAEPVGLPDDGLGYPPHDSDRVDIVNCRSGFSHAECAWAYRAGRNGTIEINERSQYAGELDPDVFREWEYILLPDGYAVGNATMDGSELVVTFRPVSAKRVFVEASADYENEEPLLKNAVRHGTASKTAFGPKPVPEYMQHDEYPRYVLRGGTVYVIDAFWNAPTRYLSQFWWEFLRVTMVVSGIVLTYRGAATHSDHVEEFPLQLKA